MSSEPREKETLIVDLSANDGDRGPFNMRLFVTRRELWHSEYNGPLLTAEETNPLRYRAWVLQEKELSTKNMHFGLHQLLWECRELKATSQLPWHLSATPHEPPPERTWAETQSEMTLRWLNLTEEYSKRALTKQTDKLPALSGIAQSFQKYFPNDRYIAGMWSSHLPLALLWRPARYHGCVRRERYPTDYVAPTWSCVYHPDEITCEWWVPRYFSQKFGDGGDTSDIMSKWVREPDVEIADIIGQPKHGDAYGALEEGAALKLRSARLFEIDAKLGTVSHYVEGVSFFKDGKFAGTFVPDAGGPYPGKMVCLSIFKHSNLGDRGLRLLYRTHAHGTNS